MSHVLTLDDFEEAPWRYRAWYWVRRTWRKLRHCGRASPADDEYESLHHALDEEGGDLLSPSHAHYDSLASFPQGESFRYNRRSVTISVELLRSRDKNPQVLAWSLFAVYIVSVYRHLQALPAVLDHTTVAAAGPLSHWLIDW